MTTTTNTPQTWRDLANQLTPHQVAFIEGLERTDAGDPHLGLVTMTVARNYADRNKLAARYAAVPLPAGDVRIYEGWHDPEDGRGPVRYFTGTSRVVECDNRNDVEVCIDGVQYADGRAERTIRVDVEDLTAPTARAVARAIIAAADEIAELAADETVADLQQSQSKCGGTGSA